jgi:hypothetical protein
MAKGGAPVVAAGRSYGEANCGSVPEPAFGQRRPIISSLARVSDGTSGASALAVLRLKIDHSFDFRWRLHRKVGRFLALEYAADVNAH